MKVTKRQLRRIIREEFQRESYAVDISAMTSNKQAIMDWVDLLIDDLEPTLPQLQNLPDKHHDTTVRRITDSVFATLADALKSFAPHIREEHDKSAPFGSGMEQADLDPEEEELVGHT